MAMTDTHPARQIEFPDLLAGLERALAAGMVRRKRDGDLSLWVYSEQCVYNDGWDQYTLLARGLILDEAAGKVVATPFPKFFNLHERGVGWPDLPFETYEKIDGSLIVIWHHAGGWRTSTKGAFDSEQARWAQRLLDGLDLSCLIPGATYLAEEVGPHNRIVVRYGEPAMVMLAAYDVQGIELDRPTLEAIASSLGWRCATIHAFTDAAELMAHAATLPATSEGFVIRFADGRRIKVKGAEYCRIHALVSRCTPLGVWDALFAGDDLDRIRHDLPEEFWGDFDTIRSLLAQRMDDLATRTAAAVAGVSELTDKEVGLSLENFPEDIRRYIFTWRKSGGRVEGRLREQMLRAIRPTANHLAGYVASYAMNRVMDETG
jgi:RNA ligase